MSIVVEGHVNVDTTGYRPEDIHNVEEYTKQGLLHQILDGVKKHIIVKAERLGPYYMRYSAKIMVQGTGSLPASPPLDYMISRHAAKFKSICGQLKELSDLLKEERWLGPKDVPGIKEKIKYMIEELEKN